jgi:hypothetical protein
MPLIVSWIAALLETRLGSWIISALLTLGISFVSYKFSVAPFRDYIIGAFSGAPAMYANIIGYLWIDRGLTMVLGAKTSQMATKGLTAVLTKRGATASA